MKGGGSVAKRNSLVFPGMVGAVEQAETDKPRQGRAAVHDSVDFDHKSELAPVVLPASPDAHTATPRASIQPAKSPVPSARTPLSPVNVPAPRARRPPARFGFEDIV